MASEPGHPSANYHHSSASGNNQEFGAANDGGHSTENIAMLWQAPSNPDLTQKGQSPISLAVKFFDGWKQSAGHNDDFLAQNIQMQSVGITGVPEENGTAYYGTWRGYIAISCPSLIVFCLCAASAQNFSALIISLLPKRR